jgi:hypothetical protein
MARIVWSEVGGVAEAIINGQHDADLEYIQIACQARMKRMFRAGQRDRAVGTSNPEVDGKQGVIEKVNAKTIKVVLDEQRGTGTWYNFPPRMLEVV